MSRPAEHIPDVPLLPGERYEQTAASETEIYALTLRLTRAALEDPDTPGNVRLRLMLKVLSWRGKVEQEEERATMRAEIRSLFKVMHEPGAAVGDTDDPD